ncbi:MAG: hypothetical protein ABSH24_31395 [Bryobacteraceae bacterium]
MRRVALEDPPEQLGDSTKARTRLGWTSRISFEALVREMVEAACRALGITRDFQQSQGMHHGKVPRMICN